MLEIFRTFLFDKHILVAEPSAEGHAFEALFALSSLFGIRIVKGAPLASLALIRQAEARFGKDVPEPFYRGFPESVRSLSPEALLYDQLLHYARTYGLGDFSTPGHSVAELLLMDGPQAGPGGLDAGRGFARAAFREAGEVRDFEILTEAEAEGELRRRVAALLAGTRPLNDASYALVLNVVTEYGYEPRACPCKPTAIRLLIDTRDVDRFGGFLALSDTIALLDELCYRRSRETGGKPNLRKLNLRNRERRLLAALIDRQFTAPDARANVRDCYERRAVWCGLLHHLHYKPVNARADAFVRGMRGGENRSAYAAYEAARRRGEPVEAARLLAGAKGSGAVLRRLDSLLSACGGEGQVEGVLDTAFGTASPVLLMQVMLQYSRRADDRPRTFRFVRNGRLVVHEEGWERRRPPLPDALRARIADLAGERLRAVCRGRLGKAYVDPAMHKMALPLQEGASMSGYGTLPKGSRLPLDRGLAEGKTLRCFTYWEKVNDIDLSAALLDENGALLKEFSWRTMSILMGRGSGKSILFSGDETSGYNGGSEFFDLVPGAFRADYPAGRYLVFADNIFTDGPSFDDCLCTAGYMLRAEPESGEVYEPKTVATAFRVTGNSRFAYLFAIDLEAMELVWLNVARSGKVAVAGRTRFDFLTDYVRLTERFNVYGLFELLATELVADPKDADVVVSDAPVEAREGAEVIHSWDYERLFQLMN